VRTAVVKPKGVSLEASEPEEIVDRLIREVHLIWPNNLETYEKHVNAG
jgi:hypothetical protein